MTKLDLVVSCDTSLVHLAGPWRGRCSPRWHRCRTGVGCRSAKTRRGIRPCGCFASAPDKVGTTCSRGSRRRPPKWRQRSSDSAVAAAASRRSGRRAVAAPTRRGPRTHVPVLVGMRGRPCLVDGGAAGGQRQREKRGAGQRGDHVERAEPPGTLDIGAVRNGRRRGGHRLGRLRREHDALDGDKASAERFARPAQYRVPTLAL